MNQNISRSIRAAFSLPQNKYFLPILHVALVALLEAFLYVFFRASAILASIAPVLALVYVFATRLVAGMQVGYATFRRVSATHAFFMLLILITAAITALTRAGLGAFLTASLSLAGFMYIILRGEFLKGGQALGFIALYFAIIFVPLLGKLRALLSPLPLALIAASYVATAMFLKSAGEYAKKRIGYSMLDASKRALEAWMIGYTVGLEDLFESNSTEAKVKTYALEVDYGGQKDIIVIPPLHPGPFKGVGGYNLTELIYREMKRLGYRNCVVLHSASNHDMNPASKKEALRYAYSLRSKPDRIDISDACLTLRDGGSFSLYGICSSKFRLVLADPKVVMDDFPEGYIEKILGVTPEVMVVDAHNKLSTVSANVDYEEPIRLALSCEGGCNEKILADIKRLNFRSEEVGAVGVHLVYLSDKKTEFRFLVVDSNNATPEAYEAIKRCGYTLLTTDTHVSATSKNRKGYWAFGELANVNELCNEAQSTEVKPSEVSLNMLRWEGNVKITHNGMGLIREAMSGALKYFKYYVVATAAIYFIAFLAQL